MEDCGQNGIKWEWEGRISADHSLKEFHCNCFSSEEFWGYSLAALFLWERFNAHHLGCHILASSADPSAFCHRSFSLLLQMLYLLAWALGPFQYRSISHPSWILQLPDKNFYRHCHGSKSPLDLLSLQHASRLLYYFCLTLVSTDWYTLLVAP